MDSAQWQAFLDAIRAEPDDDAVRLIYADWLDDHGDPARAEFIRVQIERAQLPEWDRRHLLLKWREEDLLDENGPRWRAELPVVDGITWGDFERGFVSGVRANSPAAVARSEAVVRRAAPVTALRLDHPLSGAEQGGVLRSLGWVCELWLTWPGPEPALVPWLPASLRTLDLGWGPFHPDEFARLCQTEFPHLRALRFSARLLRPEAVGQLAEAPWLTQLDTLFLHDFGDPWGRDTRDEVVLWAAKSPRLARLCRFSVGPRAGSESLFGLGPPAASDEVQDCWSWGAYDCYGPVDDLRGAMPRTTARRWTVQGTVLHAADVGTLAEGGSWPELHTLMLHRGGVNADELEMLASAGTFPALLKLDLGENLVGGGGTPALFRRDYFPELRWLNLAHNGIEASELARLPAADEHPPLRWLSLSENRFGNEGLAELLCGGPFPELRTLGLRDCRLSGQGVRHLTAGGALPALRRLDLGDNTIDPHGLATLLASPLARQLTHLSLRGNPIGDAGLELIANCAALERLWVLNVRGTGYTQAGVNTLLRSPHLPLLRAVGGIDDGLGAHARNFFRRRFPDSVEGIAW